VRGAKHSRYHKAYRRSVVYSRARVKAHNRIFCGGAEYHLASAIFIRASCGSPMPPQFSTPDSIVVESENRNKEVTVPSSPLVVGLCWLSGLTENAKPPERTERAGLLAALQELQRFSDSPVRTGSRPKPVGGPTKIRVSAAQSGIATPADNTVAPLSSVAAC
jgi:hypothetical protein